MDASTMTAAVDAVTGSAGVIATAAPSELEGLNDLFGGLASLPGAFQTSWMVGMSAIILLLLRLTKTPFLKGLLTKVAGNRPWLLPVIGLGLGVLGGFFQGLPGGIIPALIGAVAGLGAGAGAVGTHTAIDRLSPSGAAEVDATRTLKDAVLAGDTEIKAKVEALKSALDQAVAMPVVADRLAALAKFANGKV